MSQAELWVSSNASLGARSLFRTAWRALHKCSEKSNKYSASHSAPSTWPTQMSFWKALEKQSGTSTLLTDELKFFENNKKWEVGGGGKKKNKKNKSPKPWPGGFSFNQYYYVMHKTVGWTAFNKKSLAGFAEGCWNPEITDLLDIKQKRERLQLDWDIPALMVHLGVSVYLFAFSERWAWDHCGLMAY